MAKPEPDPQISTTTTTSRRLPPPCWTPDETSSLIDAYLVKWYSLRRGNLRAAHWEEVSDHLHRLCPHAPLPKSSIQCRHKMEKLRKRYRTELTRANSIPNHRFSSSWVYFSKMASMENAVVSHIPVAVASSGVVDPENDDHGDGRFGFPNAFRANFPENPRSDYPNPNYMYTIPNPNYMYTIPNPNPNPNPNHGHGHGNPNPNHGHDNPKHGYGSSNPNPSRRYGDPNANPSHGCGDPNSSLGYDDPNGNPSHGYDDPNPNPSRGYGDPNPNPSRGYGDPNGNPSHGYGDFNANPSRGYGDPNGNPSHGYGDANANYDYGGVGATSYPRVNVLNMCSTMGVKEKKGELGKREREDTGMEMVEAIRLMGEGFVRMEKMKMEMMRETERMRMEMEMKRTEMMLDSQHRIVEAFAKSLSETIKTKKKKDGSC